MQETKKSSVDLLNGNIFSALVAFSLPIMATSLLQTAYSLIDMVWIGRVGSDAVAAIGAASMFNWFANSIAMLARTGGQIKVAHSYGENDPDAVKEYGRGALQLAVILGLSFGTIVNLIPDLLIGFFNLDSAKVYSDAVVYLRIVCGLILGSFISMTLTGLFTASGDSRTPFFANSTGLIINMILDPVLIFGLGPVSALGVTGAAIATVTGQWVVCIMLIIRACRNPRICEQLKIWHRVPAERLTTIIRLGLPSALQNMLYSGISMVLTRFASAWGDSAIAIQRVGNQIETVSWMTAEGFGSAINSFIGQNFGAGYDERVRKGYNIACSIMVVWGFAVSVLFITLAEPLFSVFINEADIIPGGASYLRILGYGEIFECVEMMTSGALAGLGRTLEASVISISLTAVRIPLALALSGTALGLDGIWWAIALSSIMKGIVFFIAFKFMTRRTKAHEPG